MPSLEKSQWPCVVIAGGTSKRFGQPKGLAKIGPDRLIDRLYGKLCAQTDGPVAINAPKTSVYNSFDHLIEDKLELSAGPLTGLHAAMTWAGNLGFECVVTSPVDIPFLPDNYIEALSAGGETAVASSQGRIHPICGIWRTDLAPQLETAMGDGLRVVHAWVETCGARVAAFSMLGNIDPFFNINTPQDLEIASTLLSAREKTANR